MSQYSSESDSIDFISGKGGKKHRRQHLLNGKVIVENKEISPADAHLKKTLGERFNHKRKSSDEKDIFDEIDKSRKIFDRDDFEVIKEYQGHRKNSDERRNSKDSDKQNKKLTAPEKGAHHHHREYHRRHYKKFFRSSLDSNNGGNGRTLVDDSTSISRVLKPKMRAETTSIIIEPVNEPKTIIVTPTPVIQVSPDPPKTVIINPKRESILLTDDEIIVPKDDEIDPVPKRVPKRVRQASVVSQINLDDVQQEPANVETDDCPFCGKGKFRKKFTWTGIVAAIFCFPCGIWCCLKFRAQVCSFCGASLP